MDIEIGQVWESRAGEELVIDYVSENRIEGVLSGIFSLSTPKKGFRERYKFKGYKSNMQKEHKPDDLINNPKHYTSHPSGIECIEITRHMSFNAGNVIKYLWRNGLKDGEPSLKDLKKAAWHLNDMIKQLESNDER